MAVSKKDIIRLQTKTQIEFSTDGDFSVQFNEQKIKKGKGILKVIEVFSTWKSIENGFRELSVNTASKEEFFKLSADFYDLLNKGFFEVKDTDKTIFDFHNGKFDSFPVHIRMLNDKARTLTFQKAIKETVKPNDIVLDIGTGNGILAATASLAGAKHVYAIERTEFIEVARAVFKANGLEDKITLIQGDSTKITLPEKATVLVSEIIGNDPFQEGIINTFNDAKERLLTPNAIMIPKCIKVFAIAVEADFKKYHQNQLSPENIANWKEWYGVDFSPFLEFNDKQTLQKININSNEAKNWKALSSSIELAHVDFSTEILNVADSEKIFSLENSGIFNGMLLYFETELTHNNVLSMHPQKVDASNHWSSQLHFVSPQNGNKFKVNYALKNLKSEIKITECLRETPAASV